MERRIMRNLLALSLMVSGLLFITSCGDDDENGDGNNDPTPEELVGGVQASVDAIVNIDENASGVDPDDANFAWTLTNGAAQPSRSTEEVDVTLDISADTEWTSDKVYILRGRITVLPGATLTIQAGTRIEGDETLEGVNAAVLMVARGGKIMAQGTANDPIIMTSTADDGTLTAADKGEWGGLVVLGNAPISDDDVQAQIEGVPADDTNGLYGGTDADDNSGVISYVSIRHGGAVINAEAGDEINGLTLGGVGSSTKIDHIEIYANSDDGVEFFGGTVDAEWIMVSQVGDDAIDIDQSYAGRVTNYMVYVDEDSDEGLEVDGREGDLVDRFSLLNGTIEAVGGASVTCDFKSRAQGAVNNLNANGGTIKLAASFDTELFIGAEDAASNVVDGTLVFNEVNATFVVYTDSFDE